MSREDTNSNVSGSSPRAIGLNSITLLVLPIFLVFALSVGLGARELAAHFMAGDGDGAMLTRLLASGPSGDDGGYDVEGSGEGSGNE